MYISVNYICDSECCSGSVRVSKPTSCIILLKTSIKNSHSKLPMLINKHITKPFVRDRHDKEITQTKQTDNRGGLYTYRQATNHKSNRWKTKKDVENPLKEEVTVFFFFFIP